MINQKKKIVKGTTDPRVVKVIAIYNYNSYHSKPYTCLSYVYWSPNSENAVAKLSAVTMGRLPRKNSLCPSYPPPPPAHILGNFSTFKKVSKSVWAGGSPPNLDNLSKRKGVLSRKFSLSFRQYIPQIFFNISNHV